MDDEMIRRPWNRKKLTGAELIRRTLEFLDVNFVFGLPGTQNSSIFDALARSSITTLVPTHELAASFMANGYARVCGRPGILLTIPGPGFTYALTGVAEARLDSAPMVWITLAPRNQGEQDFQLQAIEQSSIARSLVKEIFEVEHTEDIARSLSEAHERARTGEPGPVLVQITEEALAGEARWGEPQAGRPLPSKLELGDEDSEAGMSDKIAEAARRIFQSRRILVIAGQGANDAAASLREFVEKRRALVLTTTSGRGVVPEEHPLSLGLECSGTRTEILDELTEACDTVLALGCKFSHNASRGFRWKIPAEKLIQVDTSGKVLEANGLAGLPIVSSVEEFLRAIEDSQSPSGRTSMTAKETDPDREATGWSDQEALEWKNRGLAESWIEASEPLYLGKPPSRFFQTLRDVLPHDSILTTDSGLHQFLCRRYYRVDEVAGLITPTDFQSMGFSLPAAIGASLAAPARQVVSLVGDGGLLMSGMEILSAVKTGISLVVLVINDGSYSLIRREQLAASGSAPGSVLTNPAFEDFARALHANYLSPGGDLAESLREALALDGVTLVEVKAEDSPALLLEKRKGELKRLGGPRLLKWLKRLARH